MCPRIRLPGCGVSINRQNGRGGSRQAGLTGTGRNGFSYAFMVALASTRVGKSKTSTLVESGDVTF
jgi:hypothetical protein